MNPNNTNYNAPVQTTSVSNSHVGSLIGGDSTNNSSDNSRHNNNTTNNTNNNSNNNNDNSNGNDNGPHYHLHQRFLAPIGPLGGGGVPGIPVGGLPGVPVGGLPGLPGVPPVGLPGIPPVGLPGMVPPPVVPVHGFAPGLPPVPPPVGSGRPIGAPPKLEQPSSGPSGSNRPIPDPTAPPESNRSNNIKREDIKSEDGVSRSRRRGGGRKIKQLGQKKIEIKNPKYLINKNKAKFKKPRVEKSNGSGIKSFKSKEN